MLERVGQSILIVTTSCSPTVNILSGCHCHMPTYRHLCNLSHVWLGQKPLGECASDSHVPRVHNESHTADYYELSTIILTYKTIMMTLM